MLLFCFDINLNLEEKTGLICFLSSGIKRVKANITLWTCSFSYFYDKIKLCMQSLYFKQSWGYQYTPSTLLFSEKITFNLCCGHTVNNVSIVRNIEAFFTIFNSNNDIVTRRGEGGGRT